MELKKMVKKENILVFLILTAFYITEFTSLEFLIYQNLNTLLIFLTVSLSTLITFYLTKDVVYKTLKQSASSLKIAYLHNKEIIKRYSCLIKELIKRYSYLIKELIKRYSYLIWTKALSFYTQLTAGAKDVFYLRKNLPNKESVTKSLFFASQKFRKPEFRYKTISISLSNILILLFLVKGLKAESNSITIPDHLEIKFLAYKIFILISHELIQILQPISKYCTLQNILLTSFTALIIYLLSIKKFRERTKNILLGTYRAASERTKNILLGTYRAASERTKNILLGTYRVASDSISEKSEILQKDTKEVINKSTWNQIKKEARLFKKELKEELSSKETKKKLLTILIVVVTTIILLSGSIDKEDSIGTSFVAATAGGLCDGRVDILGSGLANRCEDNEYCCKEPGALTGGPQCTDLAAVGYYCHNATPEASPGADPTAAQFDFDKNFSSCEYNYLCSGEDGITACRNLGRTPNSPTWVWGYATTMGYESNMGECCGDEGAGLENPINCTEGFTTQIGDAGYINFTGQCNITSDNACCDASTDCVDPDIYGMITDGVLTTYCYTQNQAHNVSGSTNEDHFAYCTSHTWHDCDASETYCTACANAANWPRQGSSGGASSWNKSGDGTIGEYNGTGEIQCCGDDLNEYYRASDGDIIDGTGACCDASTDCVGSSTCSPTATCAQVPADYYYCDSGSWSDPDDADAQAHCEACGYWYYTNVEAGGTGASCCGDDGASDNFYAILTGGSPHVCMYCDGTNGNNSEICLGDASCSASGVILLGDASATCTTSPDCWCYDGESCASTGYINASKELSGAVCDTGGIYDDQYADCFTDGAGVENSTCRYLDSDPCISAPNFFDYSWTIACADEGNVSADGWYCYCDEGCQKTGANQTCTLGTRRPDCDAGNMDGSSATTCEEHDVDGSGTDICHYSINAYGNVACHKPYDGGTEGCWDFENHTTIYTAPCTTCDSDYQLNDADDECYFAIVCTDGAGWTGTQEDCFEWCWAADLTTANCFGSQTAINRTEPANATTCYVSRTCTDSVNGCGWTTSTMRQDYCDQCGPTETYNSTDYCPPVNATCTSNCANSGDIWYGTAANNITRCSNENTSCVIATDTLTTGDIWNENGSAAWCDNAECNLDCSKAAGNGGGACDAGVCVCAPLDCDQGCLFVRNSTEDNVSIFTYTGNLFITGILLSSIGTPDGSDFLFQDSSENNVAWINDVNGSLGLAKEIFENQKDYCTPMGNAFVVRDKSENCVAYINSTGDLWLRGNLTQNAGINSY